MSNAVTGKCFPPANNYKCKNCERKNHDVKREYNERNLHAKIEKNIKEQADEAGDSKRETAKNEKPENNSRKTQENKGKPEKLKEKTKEMNNNTKCFKDTNEMKRKQETYKGEKEKNGNTKDSKRNIEEENEKTVDYHEKGETNKDQKSKTENGERNNNEAEAKPVQVLKRCTGCWLMTYCDQDCQREHWQKVHKYHCKYLSGKKLVEEHKADSCSTCIKEKNTSKKDLSSLDSPKIRCFIKEDNAKMGEGLAILFGFHRAGSICNCSLDHPCQYPIPLGGITGKDIGVALHELTRHAYQISQTIIRKAKNSKAIKKETIDQLHALQESILTFRLCIWYDILVCGDFRELNSLTKDLLSPLGDLKDKFDHKNAWWKALKFTLEITMGVGSSQSMNFIDVSSINDPKFANLKKVEDDRGMRLRNNLFVSQNNLWSTFKLWPTLVGKSLVLLLPDGIQCAVCRAALGSEVVESMEAFLGRASPSSPILFPFVEENGRFATLCNTAKNPKCWMIYSSLKNHITDDVKQKCEKEEEMFWGEARDCDMCLKMSLTSHRCADCRTVQYCSPQCQQKDLHFHRTVCSTWAQDPARKLLSSKKQKKMNEGSYKNLY